MGDPNDDLLLNCATGSCCPTAARQTEAVAQLMVKDGVCNEYAEAHRYAAWFVKRFDRAPAGTLQPFINEIVRLHKAT